MSEWQPIETAPRDGTIILFSCDMRGVSLCCLAETEIYTGWFNLSKLDNGSPTHWMPLPEPPEEE